MRSKLLLSFGVIPSALGTTIYLASDSTMASVETGPITTGWGDYVAPYTTLDVSNKAVGGCSARSFTREGRFDAIAAEVRAGNWVIIEFGHNDGRSLSTHNGRTDCSGTGDEMCTTTYDGQTETGADISGIFEEHGQAVEEPRRTCVDIQPDP